MQKTYSKSYRHLITNNTIESFKVLVEKEIDKSTIHNGFAKKLARYRTAKDADEGLSKFVKESLGWSRELFLDKAKNLGATVLHDENDELILKIHNYEQSKELGSGQWCISYDKSYYSEYRDVSNVMIFAYDFNKNPDNKDSMCGFILNTKGKIRFAYWKDDTDIGDDININYKESLMKIKEHLPNNFSLEDENDIRFEIISSTEDAYEFKRLISENIKIENLPVLQKIIDEKKMINFIDKDAMLKITELYKNMSIDESIDEDTSENFLKRKKVNQFIENYFEYVNHIYDVFSENKISELLKELLINKEFNIIKKYLKKEKNINLNTFLLGENIFDLTNEDNQNTLLEMGEIFNEYKEYKNLLPFGRKFATELYYLKLYEKNDTSDFIKKLVKLNEGKVVLKESLELLNKAMEGEQNILVKKAIKAREDVLNIILDNANEEKIYSQFCKSNLKEEYPSVNKDILKKINKMVKNQKKEISIKLN